MKHFDSVLKQYAETGLRSAAEWTSLGREVNATEGGVDVTTVRATSVALYTRNQTHIKPKVERTASRAAPAPTPTPPTTAR